MLLIFSDQHGTAAENTIQVLEKVSEGPEISFQEEVGEVEVKKIQIFSYVRASAGNHQRVKWLDVTAKINLRMTDDKSEPSNKDYSGCNVEKLDKDLAKHSDSKTANYDDKKNEELIAETAGIARLDDLIEAKKKATHNFYYHYMPLYTQILGPNCYGGRRIEAGGGRRRPEANNTKPHHH